MGYKQENAGVLDGHLSHGLLQVLAMNEAVKKIGIQSFASLSLA